MFELFLDIIAVVGIFCLLRKTDQSVTYEYEALAIEPPPVDTVVIIYDCGEAQFQFSEVEIPESKTPLATMAMTLKELVPIAKELGLRTNKVRKIDLVNAINEVTK